MYFFSPQEFPNSSTCCADVQLKLCCLLLLGRFALYISFYCEGTSAFRERDSKTNFSSGLSVFCFFSADSVFTAHLTSYPL